MHNVAAYVEAKILSSAAGMFISTKNSGPVNGEVQDAIVGCAELTRVYTTIDKFHAMALFAATGMRPPTFAKTAYTGNEVASMVLADTPVPYARAPAFFDEAYAAFIGYDPRELKTTISNGIVKGVLDKTAIGAKARNGVFHLIARKYSPARALEAIYAMQQVALEYLARVGFTVGTHDLAVTAGAQARIHRLVGDVLLEAQLVSDQLLRGAIVAPIGKTVHEHYEERMRNALKVDERAVMGEILGSIDPRMNGMFKMVSYKAKGNNHNLLHICASHGQVTINTERIGDNFAYGRTMPYFPRFSLDPVAHGFVPSSYMEGLTSPEFICSGMNGRFDLINKALSTSVTGHFMRKSVLAMYSAITDNLRRVMKDNKIVQFLYGEDGIDTRHAEKVVLKSVLMSDAEVAKSTGATGAALEALIKDRDKYRATFLRIERTNLRRPLSAEVALPVNVGRIVEETLAIAATPDKTPLDKKVARVAAYCEDFPYLLTNRMQRVQRIPLDLVHRAATFLMCMQLRIELCPAVLAKLSDAQLTYVFTIVDARFTGALIEYGVAAGILACQGVSEPLTQYMLDSHHRSVSGGTNKAGLERVADIFSRTACDPAKESSKSMMVSLRAPLCYSREAAAALANAIAHVTFGRFVVQYDLLFEMYGVPEYPPYRGDALWMREFEAAHPLAAPPPDLTRWCFRFVLDKTFMALKVLGLETLAARLRGNPHLYVVHTPEASESVVVRAYVRTGQFKRGADDAKRAAAAMWAALETPVRGVAGIISAAVEPVKRTHVIEGNALETKTEYVITTVGTNLYEVLLYPQVDKRAVVSSSIGDTVKLFGNAAGRDKIVIETRAFMEDNTPNLRHLFLYADEMTRLGKPTSVERTGVAQREPANTLLRLAVASPIQTVVDATMRGEKSRVYGIAAPYMLGSLPRLGTTYNTLVTDEEFIRANTKSVDDILDTL